MAEDESDQESERLSEELEALVTPGPAAGPPARLHSQYYCRRFCQVVEDYAGRWQVPLPQLQVLQTALCCFTSACVSFPAECEHVQYVLSSLALSFFELLLFFGKDEFYEDPLKDILGSIQECQNLLNRYRNTNLELVTRIIRDGGPWEDPVLQAILKAKPVSQELVNKYLSSENPLFFELRARYLIACERIPEAMALIKSCINHPDISKDLYFHQALFTCLYMSPLEDQLFQEVGEDGLQICVEICGCALQLDLREDPNMKSLIYKAIAHFLPNDLEILRICALSIFFLERTLESYYTVEHLYKCADEEYNECTSSVQNRVRFELLPILKKGLFFDPEFWNFLMIKQNCLALLGDKAFVGLNESTLENSTATTEKITEYRALSEECVCLTDISNGELDPEDLSEAQSKGNAKKNHEALEASKMLDQTVPRHRCVICNKEFLGGHIVKHAQAHQKKGSFSCVLCTRKFRQRGLMLKHLKNHVRKIERQHLAAVLEAGQQSPALNELKCSEVCLSLENGNSDGSKDNEPETAIATSADQVLQVEEENAKQVFDAVENHLSDKDDATETSSDSCFNNVPDALSTESLPEDDESSNKESPILHKVNGAFCPQRDIDAMDEEGSFKCPANGCARVFKKIRFLNKHARKAHPTDLQVQQHIMKWNKGKCRFCQRKFADSQHFVDHLKRHVYPNVYFCLHFNCNQRFKLSTELVEHTKSHSVFKAQCNFAECCELFEELPLLYEHEAQHYLNKTPECSEDASEKDSSDDPSELCSYQDDDESVSEKETVDLPIPTWKSRRDSTEPKTYIQSVEKKANNTIHNGNESSSESSTTVLIDQKTPVLQPNSENCNVVSDQLVNGHGDLDQTSSKSSEVPLDRVADETRTENGSQLPVLQNCHEVPQSNAAALQLPSKPNQTTENTSYGVILTKPYFRPLPPSYLDERYISMPKRRKMLTDEVDAHSEQDKLCSKSERFRCGNCLTIYCNSEALEAHLAQKKCQTLFGFDSDDESA
ncbi:zinc finger protein 654 isoform 2-T2 [Chlamydotis macqueenii]